MDTQDAEMLTKGLYTKKRKRKASSDGSKRAKVGASSSEVSTPTAIASKVIVGIETTLTAEVNTAGVGSMPSIPSSPTNGDRTLELPAKEETSKGRKKKKAVAKTSRKARLSGPDGNDDDERGEDHFDNPEIIQDLIDRFAMPEVVDQMADLDPW
ncbi:hypothetical protein COCNU_08G000220 [Cocos nucifera]|uniref:Uncharacterized protein n=1 Tax=Cocos nucifera TaxID=13894 RepID=A0A8K0IGS9_COCNU|nr:hypothetical protein COCNU_08G000220 [Cocos nucifera]